MGTSAADIIAACARAGRPLPPGLVAPDKPARAARGTGRAGRAKAVQLAASVADAGREPIRLTLPYGPGVNHLYATVRGRRVLSREGRRYKAGVATTAAGVQPFAGEVAVAVDVYRPMRAGDLDGRLKCLLDAMTGVAWVDDRQVVVIHARRFDDPANPRAEVVVTPVRFATPATTNIHAAGRAGEGTV